MSVEAGQVAPIKVTAYDAEGLVVTEPRMRVSGTRGGVQITKDGVKGLRAGKYTVVVSTLPADTAVKTVAITIPVTVNWPPVTQVGLTADPGRLYVGVTLAHQAQALHADGSVRPSSDVAWRWSSSNEAVASVDRFGNVTGQREGHGDHLGHGRGREREPHLHRRRQPRGPPHHRARRKRASAPATSCT